MKTVALGMMVKNEARVVKRCLESVLPLVDYALIVDTGSTDETRDVAREFLQSNNLAGEVIDEPWRDYAYNRTFVLRKLRERSKIDYTFMVDADQIVLCDPGFDVKKLKASLHHDIYDVIIKTGDIEFLLPRLTSNRVDLSYKGVVHEYLECPRICTHGVLSNFLIQEFHDGGRTGNEMRYAEEAITLESALRVETDPVLAARYTFYLAQSYRDSGQPQLALDTYLKRTKLGFWDQEIFYSYYSAAKLMEQLDYPSDVIIETYLKASRISPYRAEALHGIARYCRIKERYEQGYRLAKKGLRLPCPKNGLFIERWVYDFGLLDEFSVLAFLSGRYTESLEACTRLLVGGGVPASQRERVQQNAHFAVEKVSSSSRAPDAVQSSVPTIDVPSILPGVDAAASIVDSAAKANSYAIVTPYYRENRETLQRCLNSVRRQSVGVDHIVIADGLPQAWIDDEPVRHIKLDNAHDDNGNTPRGLGLLMAVAERYEGIGLLDADNWLDETHVEKCLDAAVQSKNSDYIIVKRFFITPGERPSLISCDERPINHVDTSCFFFLPGSYHVLPHWILTPKTLSPICDWVFYAAAKAYGLRAALVEQPTVFYECLWSSVYQSAGLPLPSNAKQVDFAPMFQWLNSLSDDEMDLANKRAGASIRALLSEFGRPINRNASCPCGSGKRFKHCHGAALTA